MLVLNCDFVFHYYLYNFSCSFELVFVTYISSHGLTYEGLIPPHHHIVYSEMICMHINVEARHIVFSNG